ncbi:MAG: aminotransferase class III-fold pyridoxal phosphate-dependent enzyme [Dehalococcoidia bacterium]
MKEEAIQRVAEEYRRLTSASRRHWEQTSEFITGGYSSVGSVGPYPTYITRANGPYLYDADGRRIVDFMCGSMGLPLGHNHPGIRAAVRRQLQNGMFYTMSSVYERRLAELIVRRVPSVEKVRFAANGSEATMFALRLARAHTGRGKIGKMDGGYHGNYDAVWLGLGSNYFREPGQTPAGLQPGVDEHVVPLQFNHIDQCQRAIEQHKDDLAAVIVEPVLGGGGCIPPLPGFLEFLRDITTRHGIVLIFDEMISLAIAKGGAQAYYGVTPDLTTAGKSAGGGVPMAFFGGREELMALTAAGPDGQRPVVNHVATYAAHPLAMAAGAAALEAMTDETYAYLHQLGDLVRTELRSLFARLEVPMQVTGVGHLFCYHWSDREIRDWAGVNAARTDITGALGMALLNKGYYTRGRGIVSAAHKPAHVRGLVKAMEQCLHELGLASS